MTGFTKYALFPVLCFFLTSTAPLSGQSEPTSGVVAEVQGEAITEVELFEAADEELERLRLEALQLQAAQNRKRHQVLETKLRSLVADRLFDLDSEARGISLEELLELEVESKVQKPTEQEIEAFYEANRTRLQGTKEQLLPLVQDYLLQQNRDKGFQRFVDLLGQKYGASYHLEPLRFEIQDEGHPTLGPEEAPVTIVEFSDFECPFCSAMYGTIKNVHEKYGERVRLVFRQFPLSQIHPNAQKAAEASLCAHEQDQFWRLHDLMFDDQKNLKVEDLRQKAAQLGMDETAFQECLVSGKYAGRVKQDLAEGTAAGVSGTPALFVNGRPLVGNVPYRDLAQIIDEELGAK